MPPLLSLTPLTNPFPAPPATQADMVRLLQRDHLRLQALLGPADVARLSLRQQQKQAPAAPSGASRASGATGASSPPAASSGPLPYCPEFFSLAAAVKSDPRLLLRHADVAPATADIDAAAAGGDGSWGAALTRPSCLLGGLSWLWWGSSQPGAAAAGDAPPTAPPSAAPTVPPQLLPAAPPAATATQLPRAGSDGEPSGWKLAAVLPGTVIAGRGGRRSGSGGSSHSPVQAAAGQLVHAESIAARLPLSSRSGGSSSGSEGFGQLMQDAGHLLGSGGSSQATTAGQQDEAGGAAWWRLF